MSSCPFEFADASCPTVGFLGPSHPVASSSHAPTDGSAMLQRQCDGGVSLNEQVNFPSVHRLHKWGAVNLNRLGAPAIPPSRSPRGPFTQQSVSLSCPLSGQPDEVIAPPSVWPRATPSAGILKYLTGAAQDSPRLQPFDRTVHQPKQDMARGTSYVLDYCRSAGVRTGTLPPIDKRVAAPQELAATRDWADREDEAHGVRFGLSERRVAAPDPFVATGKAGLDAPYSPARHGERSIIPPRGNVFAR